MGPSAGHGPRAGGFGVREGLNLKGVLHVVLSAFGIQPQYFTAGVGVGGWGVGVEIGAWSFLPLYEKETSSKALWSPLPSNSFPYPQLRTRLLILKRGEGREKGRERNINWLPLTHAPIEIE